MDLRNRRGFSIRWTYSTELFDESPLRHLHVRLPKLLESIVEHPEVEIDRKDDTGLAAPQLLQTRPGCAAQRRSLGAG